MLLHHLKHNKVLHEKVMLLSVMGQEIPQVDDGERVRCRELGEGFYQVVAHYGFMETPDVPRPASVTAAGGCPRRFSAGEGHDDVVLPGAGDPDSDRPAGGRATRVVPRPRQRPGHPVMARWRKKLFIVMARNAQSATAFFGLPPNRVVELGAQIQF